MRTILGGLLEGRESEAPEKVYDELFLIRKCVAFSPETVLKGVKPESVEIDFGQ